MRTQNIASFNPRPHAEGDTQRYTNFRSYWFQSTPSRGGRQEALELARLSGKFQSTPSRGGRLDGSYASWGANEFQSTPSRGGRPVNNKRRKITPKFQSTPSRGGRHSLIRYYDGSKTVSIHALTRRATSETNILFSDLTVSIHALTRRATRYSTKKC